MENNTKKYYTPQDWEFCEGFEFEILGKNDKWQPWTYKLGAFLFYVIQNNLKHKTIRVKSLDREGLESLGYEKTDDNSFIEFRKDDITICQCINTKTKQTVWSIRQAHSRGVTTIYLGKIRNLFHLKQILNDVC